MPNNDSACKDIHDSVPTALSHLIGNELLMAKVRVAIEAAHIDRTRFEHCLLVGPPGMGKSTLASVIASEMAVPFHEYLGQRLRTPADLNEVLLAVRPRSIVHIDEIHECPEKILTSLYMVLDKRQIQVSTGTGPLTIPVNDFTLIASTTEEHQVLQPFRDRMRIHARLQYLTVPELCRVVAIRARNLRWHLAEDVVSEIAIRARGTPRIALNILSAAYRQARSCNAPIITRDIFDAAMHLEQIDTCGLGMLERDYLRLLKDSPVRVNVLASSLGVPSKTLTTVTEPFLVRQGLISKDDQSRRCLTAKGREHLLSLCIPQE